MSGLLRLEKVHTGKVRGEEGGTVRRERSFRAETGRDGRGRERVRLFRGVGGFDNPGPKSTTYPGTRPRRVYGVDRERHSGGLSFPLYLTRDPEGSSWFGEAHGVSRFRRQGM